MALYIIELKKMGKNKTILQKLDYFEMQLSPNSGKQNNHFGHLYEIEEFDISELFLLTELIYKENKNK